MIRSLLWKGAGKMSFYYGLSSKENVGELVVKVVSILGGGPKAISLMLEICAAETNLGRTRDRYTESGFGLFQFDKIAITDIIDRTRDRHCDNINDVFGIDLDRIQPSDLNLSPLLSAVFCRLHFLLIPDSIPDTVEGRAQYWKDHYNKGGKGSVEHYLSASDQLVSDPLYHALNY